MGCPILRFAGALCSVVFATLLLAPCAMAQIDLYIDIGHGGYDGGAATPIAGYYEKDINLEVGTEVRNILESGYYYEYDFFYSRGWPTACCGNR